MSISIKCQCGRKMLISEELEGLPVRCPNCGRRHLVPKEETILVAKPIEQGKRVLEFAKPICKKCRHEIDIETNFCPNCGIHVVEVPEKRKNKPLKAVPIHEFKDKSQEKPEIFPGPFKGREHNQLFEHPQRIFAGEQRRHQKRNNCQRKRQFVKEVMHDARREEIFEKPEKRYSGLAKFAFFTTFLALIIGLLAVLVVSNKHASIETVSMDNLRIGIGMMKVSFLFAMLGGLSALFSIFHFSHKRFLLIFVSLLYFASTILIGGLTFKQHKSMFRHNFFHFHERIQHHFDNQELDEEIIQQFCDELDLSSQQFKLLEEFEQNETDENSRNNNEPQNNDDVNENDPNEEDF